MLECFSPESMQHVQWPADARETVVSCCFHHVQALTALHDTLVIGFDFFGIFGEMHLIAAEATEALSVVPVVAILMTLRSSSHAQ